MATTVAAVEPGATADPGGGQHSGEEEDGHRPLPGPPVAGAACVTEPPKGVAPEVMESRLPADPVAEEGSAEGILTVGRAPDEPVVNGDGEFSEAVNITQATVAVSEELDEASRIANAALPKANDTASLMTRECLPVDASSLDASLTTDLAQSVEESPGLAPALCPVDKSVADDPAAHEKLPDTSFTGGPAVVAGALLEEVAGAGAPEEAVPPEESQTACVEGSSCIADAAGTKPVAEETDGTSGRMSANAIVDGTERIAEVCGAEPAKGAEEQHRGDSPEAAIDSSESESVHVASQEATKHATAAGEASCLAASQSNTPKGSSAEVPSQSFDAAATELAVDNGKARQALSGTGAGVRKQSSDGSVKRSDGSEPRDVQKHPLNTAWTDDADAPDTPSGQARDPLTVDVRRRSSSGSLTPVAGSPTERRNLGSALRSTPQLVVPSGSVAGEGYHVGQQVSSCSSKVSALGSTVPGAPSAVEQRIYRLLSNEVAVRSARESPLIAGFLQLFMRLPPDAVGRVRAALDSALIFRQDNSLVDFRGVLNALSQADRMKVLSRIRESCSPPPADRPGFVLLSDVDDTLLPGKDVLQLGGSDRSWTLDGRLYPGASRTHLELRGDLRSDHGCDYSVLLTARPPAFVRSLVRKLRRIALCRRSEPKAKEKLKMAILPGEGGAMQMAVSAFRVLTGDFRKIGETKISRLREYAELFPEYAGRFVFIGDDGQADLDVAVAMLGEQVQVPNSGRSSSKTVPLMAFVAVKCVQQKGENFVVSPFIRGSIMQEHRTLYPPLPERQQVLARQESALKGPRHRFFYFSDYADLSQQLCSAGWITPEQSDRISRSIARDKLHLAACIQACDLKALRSAVLEWSRTGHEADPCELEIFEHAGLALPDIMRAHIKLVPPTDSQTIKLQILGLKCQDYRWPNIDGAIPRLLLRSLGGDRPETRAASDECGVLSMRWPSRLLLREGDASSTETHEAPGTDILSLPRAAIDLLHPTSGAKLGRCFIVMEASLGASTDGTVSEVTLLASSDWPDSSRPVGEAIVSVRWT